MPGTIIASVSRSQRQGRRDTRLIDHCGEMVLRRVSRYGYLRDQRIEGHSRHFDPITNGAGEG